MRNDNGLFINDDNSAVGYLYNFQGEGVFSSDGKTNIPPEAVDTHNNLLSQAEINGLDKCQVGQGGTLYYSKGTVQTFVGALISQQITVKGKSITFNRNGKVFRGTLQKNADCFNFKRIK